MKTTLDLPDALVNEIKQRAIREGRDVNEVVKDLLNAGVSPVLNSVPENGLTVPKTLPLIKVRPAQPANARKLTTQEWCDWTKDADLRLEAERYEKTLGHQHVDRAGA